MSDQTTDEPRKSHLLLVTGLSGSGLSSALKTLEDLGYEAIDNCPAHIIPQILAQSAPNDRPIAFGVDTRNRDYSADYLVSLIDSWRQDFPSFKPLLVFLTCDDEILQRRFSETRRSHPLSSDGRPLLDSIRAEREQLAPVRDAADLVIDTSLIKIPEFQQQVRGHFAQTNKKGPRISVLSFAYKHGLPREADYVFDVRFLRNPHWVAELRPMDGRTNEVASYVREDDAYPPFIEGVRLALGTAVPRQIQEGKNYLTIAFGCSGGKHRSVALAEETAQWLEAMGYEIRLHHRDLFKIPFPTPPIEVSPSS